MKVSRWLSQGHCRWISAARVDFCTWLGEKTSPSLSSTSEWVGRRTQGLMPSFLSVFLCVLSFWGFLFCSYCAIVLPFPHQKAEVICLLCGWNVSSALQLPYNVLSAIIQSLVSDYPPRHAHRWWDLQLISHWLLVCCVGVFQFLLVGDTVFDYLYEVVSSISLQMQTHFPWQNNLKGSPEPLNHEWLALRVIEPVIRWQISH